MRHIVVPILSGGMDSTVLLYELAKKYDLRPVTFDYGQRHSREITAAAAICDSLNLPHKIVRLEGMNELLGGSCLTDGNIEVPEGHYAEESMKRTVVPNRNMIMLAIAAGYAISLKAKHVAYAAHAGDHTIYPDCRPEFAKSVNRAIKLADWHQVSLLAPYALISKAAIVKRGLFLGVPFEKTWSCYKGQEIHCGKCGTCVERIEAFNLAGVIDPTVYSESGPS